MTEDGGWDASVRKTILNQMFFDSTNSKSEIIFINIIAIIIDKKIFIVNIYR